MYEPILTIEDNPIYFFQGLSCETLKEYINFSFKFQDFEYIKDKIDTTYKMSQNKNDNLSEQIQGTWGLSQYNFTDHVQPPRDFYK